MAQPEIRKGTFKHIESELLSKEIVKLKNEYREGRKKHVQGNTDI